jgi:hypothetical protein
MTKRATQNKTTAAIRRLDGEIEGYFLETVALSDATIALAFAMRASSLSSGWGGIDVMGEIVPNREDMTTRHGAGREPEWPLDTSCG